MEKLTCGEIYANLFFSMQHFLHKRMCLGTFSCLAQSLATIYIFARVRIFGTLVPFYGTGHSSEFPVTQNSRIYWIFHPTDTGSLILRCSFSKNHMLIPDQNG